MAKRITDRLIADRLIELYIDTSEITQRDAQDVYEELREERELPLGQELSDERFDRIFDRINNA